MKKNYALLASALLLSFSGFSQGQAIPKEGDARLTVEDYFPGKSNVKNNKAYGDTIPGAYFDFSNNAAGFTMYENANTGYNWVWSTQAPGGQYSGNTGPMQSTTAANGYMLLRSDSFNTPFPPGGPLDMDAYFESPAIPIYNASSVMLRFQQYFRYCCNNLVVLDVEIKSNLNPTWQAFNVKNGVGVNNATPNPMLTEINISSAAANADTIWFRFHNSASSHYFWMVDDVAVVEGPTNDLVQEAFSTQYDTYGSPEWQWFEQIPLPMVDTMFVRSTIINNGGENDSAVVAEYNVTQDLNCFGAPGLGLVHSAQENVGIVNSLDTAEVEFNSGFLPTLKGQYTLTTSTHSTANVDEEPLTNSLTNSFIVGDSVYAKDDGTAESSVGPASYVGYGVDGARLYLYYPMPKPEVATSLSYFIWGSASELDGTSFNAELWGVDTSVANCNIHEAGYALTEACFSPTPVSFAFTSVNVTAAMRGTWVTVPIIPTLLDQYPGYAVALQANGFQTDVNGDYIKQVTVGEDLNAADQAPYDARFIYDYHAFMSNASTPKTFIHPGVTPMMRINFGQLNTTCLVGMEENSMKADFSIYPNPSNGDFKVEIATEMSKDFTLTITNMIGQNVHAEEISVNNEVLNKNMNFSHLEKGIYFVTLQNATERHTQKIVIR